MSCAAITHVWDAKGVTPEERLALIWIANSTSGLGLPSCPDWAGMGEFLCSDFARAAEVVNALIDKGLLVPDACEGGFYSHVWIAYDGDYEPPIDWTAETKSRSRRVASLIERDGPECVYCSKLPVNYEVDHFIPRAKGGHDVMANLVLSCSPCNRAKRDKLPEIFLADRPALLHALRSQLGAYA